MVSNVVFAWSYLSEVRVSALSFGFRVGDDDFDTRKQFARLEKLEGVRSAPLYQTHSVIPQRSQIHIHRRRLRTRRTLRGKQIIHK